LRNDDIEANLRRGGDVDVLVPDSVTAERMLIELLGIPRVIIRHSYVVGYCYDWGQIDLLPRLEWRGAEYLPTDAVLQHARRTPGGVSKPRLAHEALICWFSSLLSGGFFNARYEELIVRAAREDAAAFRAACDHAVGDCWSANLWAAAERGHPARSADSVAELRRAVWWRAFRRHPLATVRRYASFWKYEIELRRKPPLPSMAFLGPDGSGKSSVISAISLRLGPPVSSGVHVCHWRPGRFRRPSEDSGPVTDPHGKAPRGYVLSTLKLGFLLVDWVVGYYGNFIHLRAKGHILVFDRHYIDICVDPRRYRYGGARWIAALVGYCVHRPDVLIVLDAPLEVLRERKQEVTEEEIVRQRLAYQELASQTSNSYVVDATQPLQEIAQAVEHIVFEHIACSTRETLQNRGVWTRTASNTQDRGRILSNHSRESTSYNETRVRAEEQHRGDPADKK